MMGINSKKFKEDLADGLAYEQIVLARLKELGWEVEKNEDEKGVDFLMPSGDGIEVKRDNKSMQTGNFYFETECYKKPSGIYKYDNVKYWIHGTEDKFHILDMEHIKGLIEKKGWGVSGGDGGMSRGKILPTKAVENAAILTINLNENENNCND